jgi:FkbM family methyltransferase
MEKLGTDYGGWYVPKNMKLNEKSIVYSGGVGEDMSFDLLLNDKYDCKMFLIDPTSRAVNHYNEVRRFYDDKTQFCFEGDIQPDYKDCIEILTPNFENIEYINEGLWNRKDILKFYKQKNEKYVSQSLIENMFGEDYDTIQVNSIKNIMEQRHHEQIDLLKLDIEGAEIEVINQMLDDKVYPKYLLVEFDLLIKNKDPEQKTKKLIERLTVEENYKMLKNDKLNITFEYQL